MPIIPGPSKQEHPAFLNHPHIQRYRSLSSSSATSQDVFVTQNFSLLHQLTVGIAPQSQAHYISSVMWVITITPQLSNSKALWG